MPVRLCFRERAVVHPVPNDAPAVIFPYVTLEDHLLCARNNAARDNAVKLFFLGRGGIDVRRLNQATLLILLAAPAVTWIVATKLRRTH